MGVIKDTLGTLGAKAVNGLMNAGEALIRGGAKAVQNLSKMSEKQLESIGTQNITPQGGVIYNDKSLNNPITMDSKSKANLDHIKNDINLINYEVENPNKTTMRVGNDIIKAIEVTNDTNIKSANRIDKKLDSMAIDIYKSLSAVGSGSSYPESRNDEYAGYDGESGLSKALDFAKGFGIDVAKSAGSALFKTISKHPVIAATTAAILITDTLISNHIEDSIKKYNEDKDNYSNENQEGVKNTRESFTYSEAKAEINDSIRSEGAQSGFKWIKVFIELYHKDLVEWIDSSSKNKVTGKLQSLFEDPLPKGKVDSSIFKNKDLSKYLSLIKSLNDDKHLILYLRGCILDSVKGTSYENKIKINKEYFSYDKFKYDFSDVEDILFNKYKNAKSTFVDKKITMNDILYDTNFNHNNVRGISEGDISNLNQINEVVISKPEKLLTETDIADSIGKDNVADEGLNEISKLIKLVNEFSSSKDEKLINDIYSLLSDLPKLDDYNEKLLNDLCYQIIYEVYNNLYDSKLKKAYTLLMQWFVPKDTTITTLFSSHTKVMDAMDSSNTSNINSNTSIIYYMTLVSLLFYLKSKEISIDLNSTSIGPYSVLEKWAITIYNTIEKSTKVKVGLFSLNEKSGISNLNSSIVDMAMYSNSHDRSLFTGKKLNKEISISDVKVKSQVVSEINSGERDEYGNLLQGEDLIKNKNRILENSVNLTEDENKNSRELLTSVLNNTSVLALGEDELAKLVMELNEADVNNEILYDKIQELEQIIVNGTLKQHLSAIKSAESNTEDKIINGGSL